jgi:hypothetical protein
MTGGRAPAFNFGKPKSSSTLVVFYFFSLLAFFIALSCSNFYFSASDMPVAMTVTSSLVTGADGVITGGYILATGSSILTSSLGAGVGTGALFGGAAALTSTIGSGYLNAGIGSSTFSTDLISS